MNLSIFFFVLAVFLIVVSVATTSINAQDDVVPLAAGQGGGQLEQKGEKDEKKLAKTLMKRPTRRSLFAACRSEIKKYECMGAKPSSAKEAKAEDKEAQKK